MRAEIRDDNNKLVLLEADPASAADDDYASEHGLACCREILQFRRPLPLGERTDLDVRPFTESDTDAFLEVNTRAFAWHPDRSHWTLDDLHGCMAESWFDPQGLFLAFDDKTGALCGFHWTKVHGGEHHHAHHVAVNQRIGKAKVRSAAQKGYRTESRCVSARKSS